MATVLAWSIVAEGFGPTTPTAVYTVPGATQAAIKLVTLFNTNAATQIVLLYIHRAGGTRRVWRRWELLTNESGNTDGDTLVMGPGDSLDLLTTTGSALDYTVSAGEKTTV